MKKSCKLVLVVLLCGMALACSKEQDNQKYIPILPGAQKLQLAQIGYSLQSELNTPANQDLLAALDTFSFYMRKPGFPVPWIQQGDGYTFANGEYEYDAQAQTWQRLGEDTCMRLTVMTTLGVLEASLSAGNESRSYRVGNQSYRFPNSQSVQFKQNGVVLLQQQNTFSPYGALDADSVARGVRSEMFIQTAKLHLNGIFLMNPESLDVSVQVNNETQMLMSGHMAYTLNQSWNLEVNVKNMCYIYSSIADMTVLKQSLQACADQYPKVNGQWTESYCRAVRDTLRKYVPSYLNFDHSSTPTVELLPEYTYLRDALGTATYDMFPVMRFSDGSLSSMEEFVSYQKLKDLWYAFINLYSVYR